MLAALILAYVSLVLALTAVVFLIKANTNFLRDSTYHRERYAGLERRYERLLDDHEDLHQEKRKMDKALEAAHMSLELVLTDISKKDEIYLTQTITNINDPAQGELFEGTNG